MEMRSRLRFSTRSLLRLAGYEARRFNGHLRLFPLGRATRGILFEMMGPSGVGKTTLLNAALGRLSGRFLLSEDMHRIVAGRSLPEGDNVYYRLYVHRFQNILRDGTNLSEKVARFNYHSQLLLRDLTVFDPAFDQGAFLEEGVCHCFRDEVLALPDDMFHHFIRRRVLIHVTARDTRQIGKQILRRHEATGGIRPHHQGKNVTELAAAAAHSVAKCKALADRAQAAGGEVLTLYADDNIAANVARLVQFEAEILARQAQSTSTSSAGSTNASPERLAWSTPPLAPDSKRHF